ncbi:lipopolysaccharide heptosyltransferase II [Planctomycetota bacterium]
MSSFSLFDTFTPDRIMLRAPNWLGDCIMAIPGMKAFRDLYPAARITVAVKEAFQELYSSEPWCDDCCSIRSFRKQSFDMAVLYPNSFASAWESFRARIPVRVGYGRDCRSFMLSHRVKADKEILNVHQVLYYMRLTDSVRKTTPAPEIKGKDNLPLPELTVSGQIREHMRGILKERLNKDPEQEKPAVWAPGASYGPAKQWPEEHVIQTIQTIYKQSGIKTVLVGGRDEQETCSRIQESTPEAAVSLCGETTIGELAGLLSWGCQYVGNDSGASHMAGAVGIPTLVLFGSTSPSHTVPLGPCVDWISLDLDCSPCMKRKCPLHHRKCLYDITPEMVLEKLVIS